MVYRPYNVSRFAIAFSMGRNPCCVSQGGMVYRPYIGWWVAIPFSTRRNPCCVSQGGMIYRPYNVWWVVIAFSMGRNPCCRRGKTCFASVPVNGWCWSQSLLCVPGRYDISPLRWVVGDAIAFLMGCNPCCASLGGMIYRPYNVWCVAIAFLMGRNP